LPRCDRGEAAPAPPRLCKGRRVSRAAVSGVSPGENDGSPRPRRTGGQSAPAAAGASQKLSFPRRLSGSQKGAPAMHGGSALFLFTGLRPRRR
jgi:hypothetical protein